MLDFVTVPGEIENLKENIIVIGGSDYINLNIEQKNLIVGVSSQCEKDLDLSMAGSTFYTECFPSKQKVEISYVGRSTVDIQLLKKVKLIEMRGDVLPDTEQDFVIWHLGGLPPDLLQEDKHMQVIKGITAADSTMRRRVIHFGGRKRNKYKVEKQEIHIGLSQDCHGQLKLVDHTSQRKALQCVRNGDEVIYRTSNRSTVTGKGDGQLDIAREIIYVSAKVPKKTRKKLSRVVGKSTLGIDKKRITGVQEKKIMHGKGPILIENKQVNITSGKEIIRVWKQKVNVPNISGTNTPDISENVEGKTMSKPEIIKIRQKTTTVAPVKVKTSPILVSEKFKVIKTGQSAENKTVSEEIVIVGERPLTERIIGKIFEVDGGRRVETKNEDRLIEIGSGRLCRNQLGLRLTGSALISMCEGRNVTLDYIGQGPTDLEVFYRTLLLEGNASLPDHQQEDSVVMYIGGIPANMKNKSIKSYFVRGVSPKRDMSSQRMRKERIVEIIREGSKVNRNTKQVVMVGVSRKCEDLLRTVSVSGKHIVECAKINTTEIKEIGQSVEEKVQETNFKEIVIHGGPGNKEPSYEIMEESEDGEESKDIIEEPKSNSGDSESDSEDVGIDRHTEYIEPIKEFVDERLLMIGGTESVTIDDASQKLSIGFRGTVCNNANSYRVMSQDTNLIIDCGRRWSPVNIIYMGKSATDIYLSKSILVKNDEPSMKNNINLYFGGRTKEVTTESKVVEIVRNVHQSKQTGISKVLTFGGPFVGKGNRTVLDVGFSAECQGQLYKEDIYGRIIISCRRGVDKSDIVHGMSGNDIKEEKTVVISGQTTNERNDTIVISGHTPRKERNDKEHITEVLPKEEKVKVKTDEIVIFGGPADSVENEITDEGLQEEIVTNKTLVGNRDEQNENTFIIKGKDTDGTESKILNKTVIFAGKGAEKNTKVEINVEPNIVERERNKTIVVAGKGGEINAAVEIEVKPKVIKNEEVYIVGERIEVQRSTTTQAPTSTLGLRLIENTSKRPMLNIVEGQISNIHDKKVSADNNKDVYIEKVILLAAAKYINLNKSGQSLELDFEDHCKGNYNVIARNRNVRVICSERMQGVEFEYIGSESTDIEVKTTVRHEQVSAGSRRRDKVFIQLGGFLENEQSNRRTIEIHRTDSYIDVLKNRSKTISVNNFSGSLDSNYINVVEIGIKKTCNSGGISKYVDEEGTIVYCSRRADILPEYDDGDEDGNEVILGKFSNGRNMDNGRKHPQIAVTEERIDGNDKEDDSVSQNVNNNNVAIDVTDNSNQFSERANLTAVDNFDDFVPRRRGDLAIEEVYGKDFTSSYQTHRSIIPLVKYGDSSKRPFYGSTNKANDAPKNPVGRNIIDYDIDTHGSLDMNLGNNCKGKIEAMEVEDGVIVKCSVGGEDFQINLVGFGRKNQQNSWSDFQLQNDDSTRFRYYQNDGNFIAETESVVPRKGGKPGDKMTIHEVYYASRKRKINEAHEMHERNKRSTIAEEVGREWSNHISSRVIVPEGKFSRLNKRPGNGVRTTDIHTKPVSRKIGQLRNYAHVNSNIHTNLKPLKGMRKDRIKNFNFERQIDHGRFGKYDSRVRNGRKRHRKPGRKFENVRRHPGHIRRRAISDKIIKNSSNGLKGNGLETPGDLIFHPASSYNLRDLRFDASGDLLNQVDKSRTGLFNAGLHFGEARKEWTDNGYRQRISDEEFKKKQLKDSKVEYTIVNDPPTLHFGIDGIEIGKEDSGRHAQNGLSLDKNRKKTGGSSVITKGRNTNLLEVGRRGHTGSHQYGIAQIHSEILFGEGDIEGGEFFQF